MSPTNEAGRSIAKNRLTGKTASRKSQRRSFLIPPNGTGGVSDRPINANREPVKLAFVPHPGNKMTVAIAQPIATPTTHRLKDLRAVGFSGLLSLIQGSPVHQFYIRAKSSLNRKTKGPS